MKDKKQNKPTPKPKIDHEQRRRSTQQIIMLVVSVIIILAMFLGAAMQF